MQECVGSNRCACPSTFAELGQVKLPQTEFSGVFSVCPPRGAKLRGRASAAALVRLGHFRAAHPKIGGYDSHHKGESDAELPEDVFRAASVGGHGVEELLDEVVARSVQNDSGPQAAGLQAQPCQDEAKADHVGGDNGQTIPTGSHVIAGKNDDGYMPQGPNYAGEYCGCCE